MEELPQEEAIRILPLLEEDERRRDRKKFVYAFDILKRNSACEYSIWPMPNADVMRIIDRQIKPDDIPYEDQNEVEKGFFLRNKDSL